MTDRKSKPQSLLVVVAHPDDETFGCGSVIAEAAARGMSVRIACATLGEAGEIAPGFDPGDRTLAGVRRAELFAAARELGAAEVELLGFLDSGWDGPAPEGSLCAVAPRVLADRVAEVIAAAAPDVVLTLAGDDGHRDHLRLAEAVTDAFAAAAPQHAALYHWCLPNDLMRAWAAEIAELRPDTAHLSIALAELGTPTDRFTTVVDTAAQLDRRRRAVAAHASQVSPYAGLSEGLAEQFLGADHLIRVRPPVVEGYREDWLSCGDGDARQLRRVLPDQVTLPGDESWETVARPWTTNVVQRPAAVVAVRDVDDVITAVRFAAANGLSVSAQPIGHGATAALDGTVLLRTAGLCEVHVDPSRRVARVGAGVDWGTLLAAAGKHSLTALVGSSNHPSVVGFCLGGGLSWFSRAHGFAADSVVSIEYVDAAGVPRRTADDEDPELFWAMRGGGGDFGIVTSIEVALHPAGELYGGRLLWPVDRAGEVLRAYLALTSTAPPELTAWFHLLQFPPAPEVPEPLRAGSFVSVDSTFLGSGAGAEALLAPLRAVADPLVDTMAPTRIAQLDSIAGEPTEPMPFLHHAVLLDEVVEDAARALLDTVGAGSGSALAVVQLRHLGGRLAQPAGPGSAAGALTAQYQLMALGSPMTPELESMIRGDLTRLSTAMAPYTTAGVPLTFLGADDPIDRAHPAETLARLRALKDRRDPHGVIRSNHPVCAAK